MDGGGRQRQARGSTPLPALVVLALLVASIGSVTVASLALADVLAGWGVFFFYTLPTLVFVGWAVVELAPSYWRRAVFPFLRLRRRVVEALPTSSQPAERPLPPERPRRRPLAELEEETIGPWLVVMRIFLEVWRNPRLRHVLEVGFTISALGIGALAAQHFLRGGWPLTGADPTLVAGAGALLLFTYVFKAFGWQLLFRAHERPRSLTLAAATGFASFAGVVLPGRFDDAARIALVRRLPGPRPGVGTLALSLFMLGLLDTVALSPLAATAAAVSDTTMAVRISLAVVAGAGIGAAVVVVALPAIAGSARLVRYRLARWLGRHAPASLLETFTSAVLVLVAWILRAAVVLLLLSAFGFEASMPLAFAYLAGGAASSALPISPAGAVTQMGVGAAVLATAGIDTPSAIAFALAAQALTVLAGAAVVLFTAALHGGRSLYAR